MAVSGLQHRTIENAYFFARQVDRISVFSFVFSGLMVSMIVTMVVVIITAITVIVIVVWRDCGQSSQGQLACDEANRVGKEH